MSVHKSISALDWIKEHPRNVIIRDILETESGVTVLRFAGWKRGIQKVQLFIESIDGKYVRLTADGFHRLYSNNESSS